MKELEEGLQHLAVRMMESKLNSMRLLMEQPWFKAGVERRAAEWAARPWYEKARIRAYVKLRNARVWLGEKIAGQSFDDYS